MVTSGSQGSPVRHALIVEDNASLRALIAGAVASTGFEVEAVGDAKAALRAFTKGDPDLLIADIDLGSRPNGVELAHILRAQAPYIGVVFLTHYPNPAAAAHHMVLPERSAFLNKSMLSDLSELTDCIESALSDDVEPMQLVASQEANPLAALTPGQMATLADIAAGLTNAEIAARRGSSVRATERMVTRMFDALGLVDDPQHNPRVKAAMMYARYAGLPAEAH
jgi:DNA-binding NarL/FixJ family response regulator